VWKYALVQRLYGGRVVALRHPSEAEAIRGLRRDMTDAWMFYEHQAEQMHEKLYPELLYLVLNRTKYVGVPIEDVPDEVLAMLSPSILVEMPYYEQAA
jgi:hypothetical protein